MADPSRRVGIILAGGRATRLYPVTRVVCKQLLPVYDKPMIFYPLSTLMLAGIREILIIGTPEDLPAFQKLLGSGDRWGIHLEYAVQAEPRGIADALIIGKEFIAGRKCALILGDNVYFGSGLTEHLRRANDSSIAATVFCYRVADPSRYGVLALDSENNPHAIIEKPDNPPSDWVVTGLYYYDECASEIAAAQSPSSRGEIEITDVNNAYLKSGALGVELMSRGISWFDAGTHDALLQASQFIQAVQDRSGDQVACLEEIAYRVDFIDRDALRRLAAAPENAINSRYLASIIEEQA